MSATAVKLAPKTTTTLTATMRMPIALNPERLLSLSNFIYVVASAIVLLATFAIVYFGNRVTSLKDAELKTHLAEANARIAEANRDAVTAQQLAAEAHAKAERSNAIAEQSKLDKEKILETNLVLQKQLEDERAARLEIERRLAPRQLLPDFQFAAVTALRSQPTSKVDFILYSGNPEAETLFRQIGWVFQQVGWSISVASPVSGSRQGVWIEYDERDREASHAAITLSQVLTASNIQVSGVVPTLQSLASEIGVFSSRGNVGDAKLRIFIGTK